MSLDGLLPPLMDLLLFLLLSGCVLLARWGDHQARQLRAGFLLHDVRILTHLMHGMVAYVVVETPFSVWPS